ncbi:MAG TPA: polysaccharide deacetylase family protein [Solirubrobacterales bacterium]
MSGELPSGDGRPEALIVSDGRFYSLREPAPIDAAQGSLGNGASYEKPDPPQRVPDPWPKAEGSGADSTKSKAQVFLTVDTEDDYFETPHMLTGEGLGEEYGAYGILEILERHGLSATFFVNVYEAHRHRDPGVMESLVKTIHERGHEVALHSHPSEDLEFYSRPLYWFDADEQIRILGYGAELIEKWTGSHPVSFRAGGYVLNDHTFEALEGLGFRIDSSVFFRSDKNRITPFTVNAVRMRGKLIEVPVTYVPRVEEDGQIEHRKFDVNWLSQEDLNSVVDRVSRFGIGEAMFMMHSFSFIDKSSLPEKQRGTPIARYRSQPMRSRYVEIYGSHPVLRDRFDRFAERLASDPMVEVRTLAESEEALSQRARTAHPDIIPLV